MIVPTPEYDPWFANDGIPFQEKMCQYIKREFGDVLGADVALLSSRSGLERLSEVYSRSNVNSGNRKAA